MIRSRGARITGFAVAVGATAALIAFGVSSTGAYFTDSHDGTINAGTGTVVVTPTSGSLTLNFDNLLPGTFPTQQINYTAQGTGSEDIWLVLPTVAPPAVSAFNGVPTTGPFPLGRYGHFAVDSPAGSFTSFNLSSDPTPPVAPATNSCPVNLNGHGGSTTQAANPGDKTVPYCPVPNAILLSSGLNSGQTGWVKITFGFTKILTAPQGQATSLVANFKLVATQHGILPSDPNNG